MAVFPIVPVILCGGEGSRLWPVSRRDFPKQFAYLIGEYSFFQQAVQSLAGMEGVESPVIVTGAAHEAIVRRQLAEISVPATILVEPEGRDSAPAILAAAIYLASRYPDCVAVMQPADHHIPDTEKFREAALLAAAAAAQGHIVTFGIVPTSPDVAYGYISKGGDLAQAEGAYAVSHFAEKPSRERAEQYLADGYVWNSGIFAFQPSVLRSEMSKYEPGIVEAVESAVANARREDNVLKLDAAFFAQSPKKSLDHAVMEHTALAAVVPADFRWSDLGAWSAIHTAQEKDDRGNAIFGESVVVLESSRCLIRSSRTPIAVIGMEDIGIIAEPDGIVICRLDASASVKIAVEKLRANSRPEVFRGAVSGHTYFGDIKSASRYFSTWLAHSALPLWWAAGADHQQGGFRELLDQDANTVPSSRRLRVQARQIYVFAYAGLSGWSGPWQTSVRWGLDYLKAKYRRPDGFYRTLVHENGEPADEAVLLYDQAFVLLALAVAAKSGVEREVCTKEATHLRDLLTKTRALAGGGFFEQPVHGSVLQSNPHMHLLEAALAWCELEDNQNWIEVADSLVSLCLKHFIDRNSGALREFFEDSGDPMPGAAGKIIEPGHQFEWAWLLMRWWEIRKEKTIFDASRRLQELGEKHGTDDIRRVAIDSLSDDMTALSRQARLWPQTERLKAAIAIARNTRGSEREIAEGAILAAARGLSYYLQVAVPGLWRDKMRPDGTFIDEPAPASSLYHLSAAISELAQYAAL